MSCSINSRHGSEPCAFFKLFQTSALSQSAKALLRCTVVVLTIASSFAELKTPSQIDQYTTQKFKGSLNGIPIKALKIDVGDVELMVIERIDGGWSRLIQLSLNSPKPYVSYGAWLVDRVEESPEQSGDVYFNYNEEYTKISGYLKSLNGVELPLILEKITP